MCLDIVWLLFFCAERTFNSTMSVHASRKRFRMRLSGQVQMPVMHTSDRQAGIVSSTIMYEKPQSFASNRLGLWIPIMFPMQNSHAKFSFVNSPETDTNITEALERVGSKLKLSCAHSLRSCQSEEADPKPDRGAGFQQVMGEQLCKPPKFCTHLLRHATEYVCQQR